VHNYRYKRKKKTYLCFVSYYLFIFRHRRSIGTSPAKFNDARDWL